MHRLDDRDIQILSALSEEGRMTNAELAKRVNLSPTACWQRVRRLEETGVISGYTAGISLKGSVNYITLFVTINLENQQAETERGFENFIHLHQEVIGCWSMGGDVDYMVQVISRDINEYQRFIDKMLENDAKVDSYTTYLVLSEVKGSKATHPIGVFSEWLLDEKTWHVQPQNRRPNDTHE